jgi:hypothetical protein
MKTLSAILLALAIVLSLIAFDLTLQSRFSFDALTCDTDISCADLYMTCQGAYLCQDATCAVMECFHAADTGPRHGSGFVWLLGAVLVPLYALFIAHLIPERP